MTNAWVRQCAWVTFWVSFGPPLASAAPGDPLASIVEQDSARRHPGATAEPDGDQGLGGSRQRYASLLPVNPAATPPAGQPIPADRERVVDHLIIEASYDFLVCYPTFKAFASGSGLGVATCRFFSAPAHTPDRQWFAIDANECAVVKASPLALYEGLAFAAQPPLADGTCAFDRVPVVRLYDYGINGQPNHRLLASKGATAAMQGRARELEGAVFRTPP